MNNRRLKMTLLELLDASPRLQKRLASMSLTSGKTLFHIDVTNKEDVERAKLHLLPSVFFIRNLLESPPQTLADLKENGQLISFLKLDKNVKDKIQKTPLTEMLAHIDCCVIFNDVAPLVNRLILCTLSQVMSSISLSTNPRDYLYWGAHFASWSQHQKMSLSEFITKQTDDFKIESSIARHLKDLLHFGTTGFLRRRKYLTPVAMNFGCDGTLIVTSTKYRIEENNPKVMMELQKKLMKYHHKYLTLDLSLIEDGHLEITEFTPLIMDNESKVNQGLLIVLTQNTALAELIQHEHDRAV